jgi:hypothetical protein
MTAYTVLAASVDVVHALAMLLWGFGLPLLFWHRFPRLSRGYMWFSVTFILVSVISHVGLGECALTRLARELWNRAGTARDETPFLSLLVNRIAGFRPSDRQAVWVWEAAVLVTSVGGLRHWRRAQPRSTLKGGERLSSR